VIYDEQNIDSVAMFRNALEKQQTPLIRAFSLLDAYKNYLYEKKIVRSVDGIFSISDHDRLLLLQRGASSDTTCTLPVPMIPKKIYRFPKQPTIIIVGLLSWAPNKFGILWFYDQVYPIIKSRLPDTTLLLVGLRPGKELLNLARDPSVIVTGEVPSITPYYQQASVLVAPILAGGGIRIKILHALAAGVPVVSTKMGAEGIKAINGKHFFIANTEKKLAAQIIKVLTDKKVAQTLSFNGLQFIGKYYNEKKAEKILAQMLDVKAD
jgi:glycosyltransferase involved in cell wall biosynthesis